MTHTRNSRFQNLTPAGRLVLGVAILFAIAAIIVMLRPLTDPIRNLPGAGTTPDRAYATITPKANPTITPAATLPAGWRHDVNLNNQPVLLPPAEIATQVQSAFATVLACNYAADAADQALIKQPDYQDLCEVAQHSASGTYQVFAQLTNSREVVTWGVPGPVQCPTLTTCMITQAKLGLKGLIYYQPADCKYFKASAPCIGRRGTFAGLDPYVLFTATVTQENGTWKLTAIQIQKLPGPPPAP